MKWDSKAERRLLTCKDIVTLTVLHGSCADADGDTERIRILNSTGDSWAGSTKYDIHHFVFVFL